jgi:hypothetical protein
MGWAGVVGLAIVAFSAYWQWVWFWRGHRSGVASIDIAHWQWVRIYRLFMSGLETGNFRYEYSRAEKPFQFRLIQIGRIVALLVTVALFLWGFRFFL